MRAPVFGHGHLRLYLLSLLAERSQHGYELIQALEDRFGGTYTPSAGTIYPRLAKLESEGLVTKTSDGRKTVYEITDAGRAELASRQTELDDIEQQVTDSVRRLADEVRASVSEAMKTLRADLAAAGREAQREVRWKKRGAQQQNANETGPQPQAATADAGTPGREPWQAPAPASPAPGSSAPASSESTSDTGVRGEASAFEPEATAETQDAAASGWAADTAATDTEAEPSAAASRVALRRAEAALASFRGDLRAELRTRAARGRLDDAQVERLEAALEAARATLR